MGECVAEDKERSNRCRQGQDSEIWASNVSHGVWGMIKWVNPCNVFVAEPRTEQRLLYKLLFLFRGLWIKKRIY